MTFTSAFAIYFVLWWLVLFVVLPFGIRSQEEHGEVVPGSEAGAPHRPALVKRAIVTTVVSALLFVLLYLIVVVAGVTLDDIPFLPRYD